jgi:hypothetical protein
MSIAHASAQSYSDMPVAPTEAQTYSNAPTSTRKKPNIKLIAIIAAAALVVIAGAVVGILALTGAFGGADKDKYSIGSDQVSSVSYALGEKRKVQSTSESNQNGVETLSIVYGVSGQNQGNDMRNYFAYLCSSDGFAMRTNAGDAAFSAPSGTGIQAWKNSAESGYMIIVQADYDAQGYTITVMRGEGQTSTATSTSPPTTSTTTPSQGDPPTAQQTPPDDNTGGNTSGAGGVALDTGDPEIDALVKSLTPPGSTYTRVEGDGAVGSAKASIGMDTTYTQDELKEWYEDKFDELNFIDTTDGEDPNQDNGTYRFRGTIDGQKLSISLHEDYQPYGSDKATSKVTFTFFD